MLALAHLRRPATAIMALACVVVAVMYATNHDMGGDPDSPRGDGRYRPVLARGDGHMMFLMARSIVFDRDLHFDNDLARFGDPWGQPRTATGRKGIPHPIGPPLVWAPVLALAHGGAVVAGGLGADIEPHGYTAWHHRIVFFTSVLFGCGAVLLGRRLATRVLGGGWAPTYAAVAILLGSSLTYYTTTMPSYGHALDAFACAAFLGYWAATVGKDHLRRYVVLGALLGFAMLIRVQEVGMGVALAVELGARAVVALRDPAQAALARVRRAAGLIGRGVLALAVALVCFIPQLLAWDAVYGMYMTPQGDAYTRWGTPMVAELLWSARNGWLVTTPVVYLAVIGLCLVPRRHRLIGAVRSICVWSVRDTAIAAKKALGDRPFMHRDTRAVESVFGPEKRVSVDLGRVEIRSSYKRPQVGHASLDCTHDVDVESFAHSLQRRRDPLDIEV